MTAPMPADFPGRRPGQHRFDGPGGTLVHRAVRDAVADYLGSDCVANDHGGFPASRHSDELVARSAGLLAGLLGGRGGRVAFGAGMTALTTTFVRAVAGRLGPGDEVVCTELDHEANRAPWQALAARGVRVREARMTPAGLLPAAAVAAELSPRTRWVAVTAASNALGTMPDLAAITAAAHAVGARVFVDGVQVVAHHPVDLGALGCDAFVTAAYKWYGPHCGVLWLTEAVAAEVHLPEQVPSADPGGAGHLQLGTTSFEAVLGAGVAAEVLAGWDRSALAARERDLATALRDGLAARPEVRLLGPPPPSPHCPIVTFQVAGVPARQVAEQLGRRGVSVWDGTFYASSAMRAVAPGEPDAIRAGIAAYTTAEDVAALLDAVDAVGAVGGVGGVVAGRGGR